MSSKSPPPPPPDGHPPHEPTLRDAFWSQVKSLPQGYKLKECLQCGTCTGSCPVAHAMDITPREVVALFRAGMVEDILRSRTIWLCASCYTCTVRCPVGIQVTDTLYALKRVAMERKIYPDKFPVHVLSETFIDNIYKYGRNFELGLGARFFLKADPKKLVPNARLGLMMMNKGRMALRPTRIKRVNEVRAIIDKARTLGGVK